MAFKVLLFTNSNRYGSTETYYHRLGTGGYATVKADAQRLITARGALLGRGASIVGCRFEDLSDPGMSEVFETVPFAYPTPASRAQFADPWTAGLVNLYTAGDVYRRSLLIRWMPSSFLRYIATDPDATFAPAGAAGQVTAFLNYLKTGQDSTGKGTANCWCLRGRAKPVDGVTRLQITGIGTVGGGDTRYQIQTATAIPGVVQGSPIHIHGATWCTLTGINGDTTVAAITPPVPPLIAPWTYTLKKKQCCTGSISYDRKATVYPITYTYIPIADTTIRCTRVRKTGRRFFATRGRRRKGACC